MRSDYRIFFEKVDEPEKADMWAFVLRGAVLWFSVTGVVTAASATPPSPKLRFTKEYAQYLCEQQKLEDGPSGNLFRADGNVSEEASSDWLDAEVRLREKFKSAISNPYPPELQGYKPKGFELVEFLWAPTRCSEGRYQDGPKPGADFRCRLDKVVLKDQATGKRFLTNSALVDFDFIYENAGEQKLEDEPRALPSQPYKIVGEVALKGTVDGKTYAVVHHWIRGSPAETIMSSEWGAEQSEWSLTPPSDLPIVTASNAFIFSFDLKNQQPIVQDLAGGPLKAYKFQVHGCRR